MTGKEFDKQFNYKKVDVKCCLTCLNARRWAFEGRYSEDPSDLVAMCLEENAPRDPITFGGGSVERKYVTPFHICDKYKKDKDVH